MSALGDRIRSWAATSARPGQMDDLERIAKQVDDLHQRITLALEASYWDRPYDTRMTAIREALHTPNPPGQESRNG